MNYKLLKGILLFFFIFIISYIEIKAKNNQNLDTLKKYKQIFRDYFLYDKKTTDISSIVSHLQAYFNHTNTYEALSFYNEVVKHANSISSLDKKIHLYKSIGIQYKLLRQYELAAKYLYLARNSSQKAKEPNAEAWCDVDIGNLYYDYGQFKEAITHYRRATEIFLKIIKDPSKISEQNLINAQLGVAVATENIGLSMLEMGNYDSALYYIKKNEKYRLDPKQPYINQQYYYLTVGATYFENKKYDSAFFYFNLSLNISPPTDSKAVFPEYYKLRSQALTYIGMYYLNKNQPNLAYQYFQTSLKTAEGFDYKLFLIQNYLSIIRFLLSKNMNSEAYKYLIMAQAAAHTYNVSIDKKYDLLLTTAEVYTKLNQIEKAKKVQDTIMAYLDSLNQSISAQSINLAKLDVELQENLQRIEKLNLEKEYQAKQLSNQKIIMWLLVAIAITLAVLFGAIYYFYVQRSKLNKKLSFQNKELTELNERLNQTLRITEQMNLELVASQEELTRINQDLDESNKTKNTLFSIIAHDLKNAIGGVMSMNKMIVDDFDKFEKLDIRTFVNLMNDAIIRMYKLMENLLLWSSSQRGNIKPTKELNYPYYVVENTIQLYQQAINEKNLKVINQIPKDFAFVFDATLFDTVIRNLVNNSIKFSNIDGEIKISCSREGKEVLFCVCDNGVGMPQDKADKIFKIDKNKSTTGTKGEKGTGLGLMVCYDFVKMHNGRIWFESEVGKGTKAFFTFEYLEQPKDELN